MEDFTIEIMKKMTEQYNIPKEKVEELIKKFYDLREQYYTMNLYIEHRDQPESTRELLWKNTEELQTEVEKYGLHIAFLSDTRNVQWDFPVLIEANTEKIIIDWFNKEEISERAERKAKKYSLSDLIGTEKQIAWGNSIRIEFLERCEFYSVNYKNDDTDNIHCEEAYKFAQYLTKYELTSSFWIDNRKELTDRYIARCMATKRGHEFRKLARKYMKLEQEQE